MVISRRAFLGSALKAAAFTAFFGPRISQAIPQKSLSTTFSDKKLKLLFIFGRHSTPEDKLSLEPHLKKFKPHVVCLEVANASNAKADLIERIFSSDNPKEKSVLTRSNTALHEVLRKYKPRVHVLERVSDAEEKAAKVSDLKGDRNRQFANMCFSAGLPRAALKAYKLYLDAWAEENNKRERQVKREIADLQKTLERKYPELKGESEIRVLIKYGTSHTPISISTRKMFPTKRAVARPAYFTPTEVYSRRATLGVKSKEEKNDEIARTFIGDLLVGMALETGATYSNSAAYANLTTKKIGLKQFNNLSKRVVAKIESPNALYEAFKTEGILAPRTKEEVHAFLKRNRIPLAQY